MYFVSYVRRGLGINCVASQGTNYMIDKQSKHKTHENLRISHIHGTSREGPGPDTRSDEGGGTAGGGSKSEHGGNSVLCSLVAVHAVGVERNECELKYQATYSANDISVTTCRDKVQDKDMFTELVRSVRRSRITKNCSFVTKIDGRPYMY